MKNNESEFIPLCSATSITAEDIISPQVEQVENEYTLPIKHPHSVLCLEIDKHSFDFRQDGTVLHDGKEIGISEELISEMLKFFKSCSVDIPTLVKD